MSRIRKSVRIGDDVIAMEGPDTGVSGDLQKFQMINGVVYGIVFVKLGDIRKIPREYLQLKDNIPAAEVAFISSVAEKLETIKATQRHEQIVAKLTKQKREYKAALIEDRTRYDQTQFDQVEHNYGGWSSIQYYPFGLPTSSFLKFPQLTIDIAPMSKEPGEEFTTVMVSMGQKQMHSQEARRLAEMLLEAADRAAKLTVELNPWLKDAK